MRPRYFLDAPGRSRFSSDSISVIVAMRLPVRARQEREAEKEDGKQRDSPGALRRPEESCTGDGEDDGQGDEAAPGEAEDHAGNVQSEDREQDGSQQESSSAPEEGKDKWNDEIQREREIVRVAGECRRVANDALRAEQVRAGKIVH